MILQNAVFIPEQNRYYCSTHRHDFVRIDFDDGKVFYIDGGLAYLKRGGDVPMCRVVDISLDNESPVEAIRRRLLWGSYGKDGQGPLTFQPIAMLELDHLCAILRTQTQLDEPSRAHYRETIQYWIDEKSRL